MRIGASGVWTNGEEQVKFTEASVRNPSDAKQRMEMGGFGWKPMDQVEWSLEWNSTESSGSKRNFLETSGIQKNLIEIRLLSFIDWAGQSIRLISSAKNFDLAARFG